MKIRRWIFGIAQGVIFVTALFILLFVTVNSFLFYTDILSEDFNFTDIRIWDDPGLVIVILVLTFLAYFLVRAVSRFGTVAGHILFGMVFVAVLSGCAWWVVNSQSTPASDSKAVYDIAVRAAANDLQPIAPTGSYMSLWPFQSGLLLYFEMILRCFPGANHIIIQGFNLGAVGLALISGYFLVKRWFSHMETAAFWSILMLFCLPYYLLVNFVYGDVPGLSLVIFGTWMLTEFLHSGKKRFLLLGIVSIGGGIALRKNFMIFAVACVLVAMVLAIAEKRRYIAVAAAVILVTSLANTLPVKFYEYRAGNTMGDGVPAVSYIAMGLQGNGGWNGYHADLYMQCDFQAEPAKEISRKSIRESLDHMKKDPLYALNFFYQKQVNQWCDEVYGFVYETVYSFGNRTEKAWDIYCGKWKTPVLRTMNAFQSTVYLGALMFCISEFYGWLRNRRRKEQAGYHEMWRMVWLVTVIGGFFFTMVWEAGTRYTLPYLVMLTPYSAEGLRRFFQGAERKLKEKKGN